MMGIVESRQGGGCFVTDLSASKLLSPLSFYLQLRDYSTDELFRARSLIDGGLAADAARNGDQQQKGRLMEMAILGHDLWVDPVGFRVMDAQFHELVSAMARNGFLHSVSQSLYSLAMELRRRASKMPGVTERSAKDHQAIADAIVAGDADSAQIAMLTHVEHIRVTTLQAAELTDPSA